MIGVDLFGPVVKSTKGNRYCLTLLDYFTKWVETRTFMKKMAAKVKEALRDIFFTHGLSEVILTDQGSEFKKELTSDCPEVTASVDPDEDSVEAFVQLRGGQDEKAFGKVICNVERAQERQKLAYQRKMKRGIKCFIITPGMEVLKKDERKKGRPGRTMDPSWSQATFRVTEVLPNNLVQLETLDGKPLRIKTPYASVKPLRQRTQPGWPTESTPESAPSGDAEMCSFESEEAMELEYVLDPERPALELIAKEEGMSLDNPRDQKSSQVRDMDSTIGNACLRLAQRYV
ncbi:uncharacterized protein LOC118228162 [Anguilla anguilla]|uniref:uncharacterized protein LOC118228162 n=1 Tax=Anguilla anguilla TaxID=7936 RepID=UPI0015B1102E|nr:uncharacterized protein LOC118228162 [Anguilla anguilla]